MTCRSGSAAVGPDVDEAFDALESALAGLPAAAADAEVFARIARAKGEAARAVAGLSRGQLSPAVIERALTLSAGLRAAGLLEGQPSDDAEEVFPAGHGLSGILARMLERAAWQSPSAPVLGDVPETWWGPYVAWLFSAPRRFTQAGEADRYAAHFLRHAAELARWVERNPGSAAVRAALENYLSTVQGLPLFAGTESLRRQAEAHGRILTAASGGRRTNARPATAPPGRRLRLAFVASHPAALPAFYRSLDAQRFEVTAFALEGVEAGQEGGSAEIAVSAILSLLRSDQGVQQCRQLPATLVEQMAELSRAEPDVIVYAEDLAFSTAPLAQLAAQRIAPLQIAIAPAAVTTGLPSIDLFAIGEAAFEPALATQFSERILVLPGAGHVFTDLPAIETSAARSRAALPLADNTCVVMTAVRLAEITPEKMQRWAALLSRVAGVTLVIQLLHAGELPFAAIEALGAEWDGHLAEAGIAPQRGLILASPIASLADLQTALAAADIYLDGAAWGEPDLLHVPLALGIPLVALEGATLRTRAGAGLLRTLRCGECVARDDRHLHEIVAKLAGDPASRADLAARLRAEMERLPLCRDALATAEAFGLGVIRACAELPAPGARKFRGAGPLLPPALPAGGPAETLRLGAAALAADDVADALARAREVLAVRPGDPAARRLAGRALIAVDRPAAAVDYLLAVVQVLDDAGAWFDLATTLHRSGRPKEALQALETSLRHDGTRADAWVLLIELAKAVGADDTVREALAALRQCAPDDPRIPGLTEATTFAGEPA